MCQAFDGQGARSVCGMPAGNRPGIGRAMGRGARTSARACPLLVGILLLGPRIAGAQDELPNYRKPILTVETGGHHARVRSILWHDDATLLTAGEDKVVKVWDVRAEGRLIRSIRPPIWRGAAGTINAMAETRPDAPAGSPSSPSGITGSKPGAATSRSIASPSFDPATGRDVRIPTGDVAARLLPPPDVPPGQVGHRNSILCLAFDRGGKWLASGSIDRTVILWELPGFIPRHVLSGHRPMSAPSPSVPTAAAWPPRAGTGRSASGTSSAASRLTST